MFRLRRHITSEFVRSFSPFLWFHPAQRWKDTVVSLNAFRFDHGFATSSTM
uniref:Uncharacterized protein n=1 Tax=Rhizobium rhizogenes TaxID=359 RepID=A0A7S5DQY7_RHIRH|nr:hypothetical protein pC5.8d_695 [Rhizobium rhizogenes]